MSRHPLYEFLATWEGDDIWEMLELVYLTRSECCLFF